jgi:hypothetical protein
MSGVINFGPEFVTDSTATPGARLSAASIDKRRGRCGAAWRDINVERALLDPSYGAFYMNDGRAGTGAATSTLTGSGTVNYIAGPSGFGSILEVDSVSTTDGEGVNMQWLGQGFFPTVGNVACAHAKMRFSDIATEPEFLFGWATIDTTVIATDAVSATDWMGLVSLTADGIVLFGSDDGSEDLGTSTIYTMIDAVTVTDGSEWVDFDIRWEVGKAFEVYVNGVLADTDDVAITSEPDGFVVPTLVFNTSGTVDPVLHVVDPTFGYKF